MKPSKDLWRRCRNAAVLNKITKGEQDYYSAVLMAESCCAPLVFALELAQRELSRPIEHAMRDEVCKEIIRVLAEHESP